MEETKNKSTISKIIEETKETPDESKNLKNTKNLILKRMH